MRSSLNDRLVLVATFVIFCVTIFVRFREFASISPRDVFACLAALPKNKIVAAAGVTGASYLLLTGYDLLVLRYVRRRCDFVNSYLPRSQHSHLATTSDSSFCQADRCGCFATISQTPHPSLSISTIDSFTQILSGDVKTGRSGHHSRADCRKRENRLAGVKILIVGNAVSQMA